MPKKKKLSKYTQFMKDCLTDDSMVNCADQWNAAKDSPTPSKSNPIPSDGRNNIIGAALGVGAGAFIGFGSKQWFDGDLLPFDFIPAKWRKLSTGGSAVIGAGSLILAVLMPSGFIRYVFGGLGVGALVSGIYNGITAPDLGIPLKHTRIAQNRSYAAQHRRLTPQTRNMSLRQRHPFIGSPDRLPQQPQVKSATRILA